MSKDQLVQASVRTSHTKFDMKHAALAVALVASNCWWVSDISKQAVPVSSLDITPIQINRIHDGDTFTITVKEWPPIIGDHISVRVVGIDTPEMTSKDPQVKLLAVAAQKTLANVLSAPKISLTNLRRDKYFRIEATVLVNQVNVADTMIANKVAKKYNGGTRPQWTPKDYQIYLDTHK